MLGKKTLIRIIILLLVGLIIYFITSENNQSKTLKSSEIKTYNTIVISDSVNTIELNKKDNTWYLFEDTETRSDAIKLITQSFERIEIIAPAPLSSLNRITNIFNQNKGKTITVKQDRKVTAEVQFYFDTKDSVTYLKKSKSDKIFTVKTRGYDGKNIEVLFPTNKEFYLSNIIFSIAPEQIDSIAIIYTNDTSKSFFLKNTSNHVKLYDISKNELDIDTNAANNYLFYFTTLTYQSFIPDSLAIDKNLFAKMFIKTTNNSYQLNLFRKDSDNPNFEYDIDLLYCQLLNVNGTNKLTMFRYIDIDPILQERNYFLKNKN